MLAKQKVSMQHVFVLNHDRTPLSPCHPERARKLMDANRAAMFRMYPFTIIMNDLISANQQPSFRLKYDPGASTTGIAIVREDKEGSLVIWAAELNHKSFAIREKLDSRSSLRRGRRTRNTRYRKPGFQSGVDASFGREDGWIAPSIRSRLDNISHWTEKIMSICPVTSISVENVRFDMQLMRDDNICGVMYQQGTLAGYEVREYLLEKYERKCCYCGAENCKLEIEHIVPRSRGGTDSIANLCIACHRCNQKKGTKTAAEFGFPHIQDIAKRPLKDAAGVNIIRLKVWELLNITGLPVESGTGGRTKYNRSIQKYPKTHWIDAACVGKSGENVRIDLNTMPLIIDAIGRGSRQAVRVNKYGFPVASPNIRSKRHNGFSTGDYVRIVKRQTGEISIGRISNGGKTPEMRTKDRPRLGISKQDKVSVMQFNDGYRYSIGSTIKNDA